MIFNQGDSAPQGIFGESLQIFLVVTTKKVLGSIGKRSGMLLNILQYTGHSPTTKILWPEMSKVPLLRQPA